MPAENNSSDAKYFNLTLCLYQVKYTCCPNPYSEVLLTLNLQRHSRYYIINLVFPCALIACMVFFTFVLPPECGERVSLCITILMAMTIFQELTSEKLPPSSDTFFLIGESIQNTLIMSWATNYSLIFGTFSVLTFETCHSTVEIPELP